MNNTQKTVYDLAPLHDILMNEEPPESFANAIDTVLNSVLLWSTIPPEVVDKSNYNTTLPSTRKSNFDSLNSACFSLIHLKRIFSELQQKTEQNIKLA
jgi:hypothetical protein